MTPSSDVERLDALLRARHTCISIVTYEEDYALELVRDLALARRALWVWTCTGGLQDGLLAGNPCLPDTADPAAALTQAAHLSGDPLVVFLGLAPFLRDAKPLRAWRNLLAQLRRAGGQLIMIDPEDEAPGVVNSHSAPFELSLPSNKELEGLLRDILRRENRAREIEIEISRSAYEAVIRNLRGLTRRQAAQIIFELVHDDRRFDASDVHKVLTRKRQALKSAGLLEYIETPATLDEIGGLARLKRWLLQRQDALSDKALEFGLVSPRGVLMLGVQGAGKSLCAKAIATAWQRPLLRLDPGALYDKYVGESEKRLRDALLQAEMSAPIILWIDEIEKGFASAAGRSTDGGLSLRMFGALLTWMQEHRSAVFLVATANDIESLPPELLRKGRFDEIFFVDLPARETRREILAIHLGKRRRDPAKFDLERLADAMDGFSGAEIEQAVIAGMHEAFAASAELDTNWLLKVISQSPPLSVTMAERIADLRAWASGRCVSAE